MTYPLASLPAPLLEREQEVALLADAVVALLERGTGGAVLIEGPPGIGKSRLLAAGLEHVPRDQAMVLAAHGTELEFELSFGGVRQLFAGALLRLEPEQRERVLLGPAGLARPVLGIEPSAGRPGDLTDPLYGLFWLAANLAELQPLVVAIDDLHWLDPESGRFVPYLARRIHDLPLLLLATARPGEPSADAGSAVLLGELGRVLRPEPLSEAATGSLIVSRPAAEVRRVTGGNPFLIAELARALNEGAELDEAGSPAVARSVLGRAERVSEDAPRLTRALALFPDGAALGDVAAVAGLAVPVAEEAADGLVGAQVLEPSEPLRFLHPLMRAAVYDELGPFARRRGHAAAAALLKARGAAPEHVAAHLLAGEPAGDPENVRILVAAADAALSATAPRAAARYLERALAEPPERSVRAELRHQLGRLQAMTGDPGAEDTLRAALAESEEPQRRADIALDLALSAYSNLRYDAAVAALEAVTERTELDPERRLAIDAMLAACAFDAGERSDAYLPALRRLPPDLPGDTPAQRLALLGIAWHRFNRGEPVGTVLELAERALGDVGPEPLAVGTDIGDPVLLLAVCGNLDAAQGLAEERRQQARDAGAESHYAAAQGTLGQIAVLRGDFRTAEAELRLGLAAPVVQPADRMNLAKWLATGLMFQGRLDEADAVLDEISASPGSFAMSQVELRRARIAVRRDDFATALPVFERQLDANRARHVSNPALLQWIGDYTAALAGSGRRAEAIELLGDYLAGAERFGEAAPIGWGHLALGRLCGGRPAREHFEQAHAVLGPSPYRCDAAWAQLELGAALRRDNQRAAARELVREALDYAARNDVRPLVERSKQELVLSGSRPRSLFLSGVDALTPSEARIAQLAAAGASNKQIAQDLFLTVRTVETHLTSAFRKLDIGSRRDLAAVINPASS